MILQQDLSGMQTEEEGEERPTSPWFLTYSCILQCMNSEEEKSRFSKKTAETSFTITSYYTALLYTHSNLLQTGGIFHVRVSKVKRQKIPVTLNKII